MGVQQDALIDKLQAVSANTEAIAETKNVLDGYRAIRQEYADLAVGKKTELDALLAANETLLRELGAAITAAYP